MLVHRYRQQQKFHETLISAVDVGDKDNREYYKKLVDGYKGAMFPYLAKSLEQERQRTKEALEKAFTRGPIIIQGGRIING